MMSVKLYRCSNLWVKVSGHPCWRVQKALEAAGVDYEVVKGPYRRGSRDELERLSGQRLYPVIAFEDGSVYRDQSAAMVERIRSGKLLEAVAPASPGAGASTGAATEGPARP
jgi:glutathione S-transferase